MSALAPTTSQIYYKQARVPHGAILRQVNFSVGQANDCINTVGAELVYRTLNANGYATAGSEISLAGGVWTGPASGDEYSNAPLAGPHTVNNLTERYFLKVTACEAAGTSCTLNSWAVTVDNPGPRNN
jgi:hypothetical protein